MSLCECGCGQETNMYHGKPRRFIYGHHRRGVKLSDETKLKMSRHHKPITKMRIITQELLKELFDYRDGELYWAVSQGGAKSSALAGRIEDSGYRHVGIDGKRYLAHRLIFLYHHGFLPQFLDHVDGDRLNNSVDNLREATPAQNQMNRKKTKTINGNPTSSIYKGVSWNKHAKKWSSMIGIDGEMKYLGSFTSEIEAAKVYDCAAIAEFGEFAKPNFDDRNLYKVMS